MSLLAVCKAPTEQKPPSVVERVGRTAAGRAALFLCAPESTGALSLLQMREGGLPDQGFNVDHVDQIKTEGSINIIKVTTTTTTTWKPEGSNATTTTQAPRRFHQTGGVADENLGMMMAISTFTSTEEARRKSLDAETKTLNAFEEDMFQVTIRDLDATNHRALYLNQFERRLNDIVNHKKTESYMKSTAAAQKPIDSQVDAAWVSVMGTVPGAVGPTEEKSDAVAAIIKRVSRAFRVSLESSQATMRGVAKVRVAFDQAGKRGELVELCPNTVKKFSYPETVRRIEGASAPVAGAFDALSVAINKVEHNVAAVMAALRPLIKLVATTRADIKHFDGCVFEWAAKLQMLTKDFGAGLSKTKRLDIPAVLGVKVTPFVRVSLDFDTEVQPVVVQGALVVGMDYSVKKQGILDGSIAEVAFKPELNMEEGVIPESMIPTLSVLGGDPIPITTDPVEIFKSIVLTMAKKLFGVVVKKLSSGRSIESVFGSTLESEDQLGCLFRPEPFEPHVCGQLVETFCWMEEMHRREDATRGDPEVYCCLDRHKNGGADAPKHLQANIERALSRLPQQERVACLNFMNSSPIRDKYSPTCIIPDASVLLDMDEKVTVSEKGEAESASKGVCASVQSHMELPLRLTSMISTEIEGAQVDLFILLDNLDRYGNFSSPTRRVIETFPEVVQDFKVLTAQIKALRRIAYSLATMDPDKPPVAFTDAFVNVLDGNAHEIPGKALDSTFGDFSSKMEQMKDHIIILGDNVECMMAGASAPSKRCAGYEATLRAEVVRRLTEEQETGIEAYPLPPAPSGSESESESEREDESSSGIGGLTFWQRLDQREGKINKPSVFLEEQGSEQTSKSESDGLGAGSDSGSTKPFTVNQALLTNRTAEIMSRINVTKGEIARVMAIQMPFTNVAMATIADLMDNLKSIFDAVSESTTTMKHIVTDVSQLGTKDGRVMYVENFANLASQVTTITDAFASFRGTLEGIDFAGVEERQATLVRAGEKGGKSGNGNESESESAEIIATLKQLKNTMARTKKATNEVTAMLMHTKKPLELVKDVATLTRDFLKCTVVSIPEAIEGAGATGQQMIDYVRKSIRVSMHQDTCRKSWEDKQAKIMTPTKAAYDTLERACPEFNEAEEKKSVDWERLGDAKTKAECVGTTIEAFVKVLGRLNGGEGKADTPTMVVLKKKAKLVVPALTMFNNTMHVLADIPRAAVLVYRVFKNNRDSKQKLAPSKAREANQALRAVEKVMLPLKMSCIELKSDLLTAGVAEPKVVAILDASVTSLSLLITAIHELKVVVGDMQYASVDESKMSMTTASLIDVASSAKSQKKGRRSGRAANELSPKAIKLHGTNLNATLRVESLVQKLIDYFDVNAKMDAQTAEIKDTIKDEVEAGVDEIKGAIKASAPKPSVFGSRTMAGNRNGFRQRALAADDITCPDEYELAPDMGEHDRHGSAKKTSIQKKHIFKKNVNLEKDELVVPPSLAYGVQITVTIELEVDMGMDLQFATCRRKIPTPQDCFVTADIVHDALRAISSEPARCRLLDNKAKGLYNAPGAMFRTVLPGTNLATRLLYCIKSHARPEAFGWDKASIASAHKAIRFLVLNSKASPVDPRFLKPENVSLSEYEASEFKKKTKAKKLPQKSLLEVDGWQRHRQLRGDKKDIAKKSKPTTATAQKRMDGMAAANDPMNYGMYCDWLPKEVELVRTKMKAMLENSKSTGSESEGENEATDGPDALALDAAPTTGSEGASEAENEAKSVTLAEQSALSRATRSKYTSKKSVTDTGTGDTTLVVQPALHVAVLSFAVINVKFSILEIEGELDLELFSFHLPITVSINLRPSIRARPATSLSPGDVPQLFDAKPTISAMVVSRPFIRTLSGRLFAKIALFGKSFVSPPIDWTGLRVPIARFCVPFGPAYEGRCFPDGAPYDNFAKRVDPPLREPGGTGSCVPCTFLVPKRETGKMILSCPPTPARTMQMAGMLQKRKGAIFPMGVVGNDQADTGNLGSVFYEWMQGEATRYTADKDKSGYHAGSVLHRERYTKRSDFMKLAVEEKGPIVALCNEEVVPLTRGPGGGASERCDKESETTAEGANQHCGYSYVEEYMESVV